MKKIKKSMLCLTLAVLFPLGSVTLADPSTPEDDAMVREDSSAKVINSVDTIVAVQESQVIRNIDTMMLGWQFENMGDSVFESEKSVELSEDFKQFAKTIYPVPLARYGGTSSNEINYFDQILPLAQRRKSVWGDWEYDEAARGKPTNTLPRQFGIVEWIKTVQAINPDAAFLPCVSVQCMTPKELANFACFLLDKADESEWGALRASYGVQNPVKLYAFEMGNEIDLYSKSPDGAFAFDEALANWYCDVSRKVIDAVKAVHPEVKFMACGKLSDNLDDITKWNAAVAKAYGKDLDYLAMHVYYSGYHLAYTQPWIDTSSAVLKSVLGQDYQPKISITEHATWYQYENDPKMVSLYAALASAQFFNRMYMRTDVVSATYHAANGEANWWSMIKKIDGKWTNTGIEQIYALYSKYLGDRIVSLDVKSDSLLTDKSSTAQVFTVAAMPKGKRTMVLALNNMSDDTAFNVSFVFENSYKLTEETVFTAPNLHSYISSQATADVFSTTTTPMKTDHFTTYKMPAKSTVFLTLESNTDLPEKSNMQSGTEEVWSGDDMFSDISNSWAKSEINFLAQQGAVSGVGSGIFAPQKPVTRAELAAMLAKCFVPDAPNYSGIFSDVSASDWFAPAVMSVFSKGLMRSRSDGTFAPDDEVNTLELAAIARGVYKTYHPKERSNGNTAFLDGVTFNSDISENGKAALAFCTEKGLIKGAGEVGAITASRLATREAASAVVYRLLKTMKGT